MSKRQGLVHSIDPTHGGRFIYAAVDTLVVADPGPIETFAEDHLKLQFLPIFQNTITSIAVSDDKTLLAAADSGKKNKIVIYSVSATSFDQVLEIQEPFTVPLLGQQAPPKQCPAGVERLCFSHDGVWMAVLSVPLTLVDSTIQIVSIFPVGVPRPVATIVLPIQDGHPFRTVQMGNPDPSQFAVSSVSQVVVVRWGGPTSEGTLLAQLAAAQMNLEAGHEINAAVKGALPGVFPLPTWSYIPPSQAVLSVTTAMKSTLTDATPVPFSPSIAVSTSTGVLIMMEIQERYKGTEAATPPPQLPPSTQLSFTRQSGVTAAQSAAVIAFQCGQLLSQTALTSISAEHLMPVYQSANENQIKLALERGLQHQLRLDRKSQLMATRTIDASEIHTGIISLTPFTPIAGCGMLALCCANGDVRIFDSRLRIITVVQVKNCGSLYSLSFCSGKPLELPEKELNLPQARSAVTLKQTEPVMDSLAASIPPFVVSSVRSRIVYVEPSTGASTTVLSCPSAVVAISPQTLRVPSPEGDRCYAVTAFADNTVALIDVERRCIASATNILLSRLLPEDISTLGPAFAVARNAAAAARTRQNINTTLSGLPRPAAFQAIIGEASSQANAVSQALANCGPVHTAQRARIASARARIQPLSPEEAQVRLADELAIAAATLAAADADPVFSACTPTQASVTSVDSSVTQTAFRLRVRDHIQKVGQPTAVLAASPSAPVLVGTSVGCIVLMSVEDGQLKETATLRASGANKRAITHLAYSADCEYFAAADDAHNVYLFQYELDAEGESRWVLLGHCLAHKAPITGLLFVPGEEHNEEAETVARPPLLVSVADDRQLTEIDVAKSSAADGLLVRGTYRLRSEPSTATLLTPSPCLPPINDTRSQDKALSLGPQVDSVGARSHLPRGPLISAHEETRDAVQPLEAEVSLLLVFRDGRISVRAPEGWQPARSAAPLHTGRPAKLVTQLPFISCPELRSAPLEVLDDGWRVFSQYIAFMAPSRYLSIMRTPIDGNPNRVTSIMLHASPLAGVAFAFDHQTLRLTMVSATLNDKVFGFWDVDLTRFDEQIAHSNTVRLTSPQAIALPPMPVDEFVRQLDPETYDLAQDFFALCCLRSQGEDTTQPHGPADALSVTYVPDLCRALGYYPTEDEIVDLVSELRRESRRARGDNDSDTTVTLPRFIRLFVNNRNMRPVGRDELREALLTLGAEPVTGLLERSRLVETLMSTADAFTEQELQQCLAALTGSLKLVTADDALPEQVGAQALMTLLGFEDS